MSAIRKLVRFAKDSSFRFSILTSRGFYNHLSDEVYLKKAFRLMTGRELNLEHPQTFNEKIQWLKLYDRKPIYTTMVDKYVAKAYVAERIGEQYIIPTLGVWDHFDEIDFDSLPNQFVLKCTHDSGGLVICRDKNEFDKKAAKKKIEKCIRRNYYWKGREWPYKDVKPRIIAEKYVVDDLTSDGLTDYKIHCFGGIPKMIEVDFDRFTNHRRNMYDVNWNYIDLEICYPTDKNHFIERPKALNEMMSVAAKLSEGLAYLRVDLYYTGSKVLFGELTFQHGSGYEYISPESYRYTLGSWIVLPIDSNTKADAESIK